MTKLLGMKKFITTTLAVIALSYFAVLCTGQGEGKNRYVAYFKSDKHVVLTVSITTVIIEQPQTQHVLIGESTYFHCKTRATSAFWLINGDVIQYGTRQKYINLGFTFNKTFNNQYYNLTIIAIASELTNSSVIRCSAASHGHIDDSLSNEAHLYVYATFRKSYILKVSHN